jgi:hypothetical protein
MTWVVTSPHRMQLSDQRWQPFGRRHALVPGAATTMCGQKAYAWPAFLNLAFDPAHEKACLDCAVGLRGVGAANRL